MINTWEELQEFTLEVFSNESDGVTLKNAHWSSDEDVNLNEHDEVIEMFQTGSVTTTIGGRTFEISLHVKEVT